MKTLLHLFLGLCVSMVLTARVLAESDGPRLSSDEMDKLVAPIALYPDSLVAIVLPASTASSDIVLAARFLSNGGQSSDIDAQPWSESVKSLAHYPEVIKWMDDNLEWTQQLGDVFTSQPSDVMAAIQRLRVSANQNGLLTDTPQQRVVVEQETVYIEPTEPDVIYVPRYDPEYVWMRRRCSGPFITFGIGFSVGDWLFFGCDWSTHVVCMERRGPGWHYVPGWRPPAASVRMNLVRDWRPDPRVHPVHPVAHRVPPVAIVPHPIGHPGPDNGGRGHVVEPGRQDPRGHNTPSVFGHNEGAPNRHEAPTRPNMPTRPQPPGVMAASPRHPDNTNNHVQSSVPTVRSAPPATPAPPAKTSRFQGGSSSLTASSSSPARAVSPSPASGNSHVSSPTRPTGSNSGPSGGAGSSQKGSSGGSNGSSGRDHDRN